VEALLKQEIGCFDAKDTGELTIRMASDGQAHVKTVGKSQWRELWNILKLNKNLQQSWRIIALHKTCPK
jgi:hypothetical protein